MLLHATGLLCALGAATFATTVTNRRGALALGAGFVMGIAWIPPDPGWIGVGVGGVACLSLVRPRGALAMLAGPLTAGAAGGLWIRILSGYGLPAWGGWPLVLGVLLVAAVAPHRDRSFAPPAVREDALAALATLGFAIAAAPGVTAGWRAAQAMNLAAGDVVRPGVHPGVVIGLAAVVALGGLHTLRRRG